MHRAASVAAVAAVLTALLAGVQAGSCSAANAATSQGTPAPADLGAAVDAELDRLEGMLKKLPAGPQVDGMLAGNRDALARARAARSPILRLWRLRVPFVGIETLAYVAVHSEQGADMPRLEALWQEVGKRPAPRPPAHPGPLLLVAMADAAFNKAEKLYHAALPYGAAAGTGSGLYYLGQSQAQRALGEFATRLAAGQKLREEPPALAALGSELDALQAEAVAAFDREPTNQDLIPASTNLKEARELYEAGHAEATALAMLEARFSLGSGEPPAKAAAPAAAATPDNSLRALYAAAADEATDKRVTRTIREAVLPLHDRLFARRTP